MGKNLPVYIFVILHFGPVKTVHAVELYRAVASAVAYDQPDVHASPVYQFAVGEEFKVLGRTEKSWLVGAFSNQTIAYIPRHKGVPALEEGYLDVMNRLPLLHHGVSDNGDGILPARALQLSEKNGNGLKRAAITPCALPLRILGVANQGELVILEDGTVWRVTQQLHSARVAAWRPQSFVFVCRGFLTHAFEATPVAAVLSVRLKSSGSQDSATDLPIVSQVQGEQRITGGRISLRLSNAQTWLLDSYNYRLPRYTSGQSVTICKTRTGYYLIAQGASDIVPCRQVVQPLTEASG